MVLLWVCVLLWNVVTVVSHQRSLSFIQHSSSFLIAPESVVKCRNKPWCTQVFCATSCLADLSCRSISVKVTGSDECLHHNVSSSAPSASVIVHSEWVTYDKAVAKDCTELGDQGWTTNSGVYTAHPFHASSTPVSVFCQLDGGQWWTVIEKRADNTLSFSRPLAEFIQGFGSSNSSHWLGLDVIHAMTSSATYELRAKVEADDGNTYYARYSGFSVDSSAADYALRYTNFIEGTAGDALSSFRNSRFVGNDHVDGCSGCQSGWWLYAHNGCCYDNPNSVMDGAAAWSSFDDLFLVRFELMVRQTQN